jgi:Protein of unknown function (DUF2798)
MTPFVPKRLEGVAFGFLLSALMSLMVSGISNAIGHGVTEPGFFALWLKSWLTAWAFAFPVVLFVAPLVRKVVAAIVKPA